MIKLQEMQDILKKFDGFGVENGEDKGRSKDFEGKEYFVLFFNKKNYFKPIAIVDC